MLIELDLLAARYARSSNLPFTIYKLMQFSRRIAVNETRLIPSGGWPIKSHRCDQYILRMFKLGWELVLLV